MPGRVRTVTMTELTLDTPFGHLGLQADSDAITGLRWAGVPQGAPTDLLLRAVEQLSDYMAGKRQCFDLPLRIDAPRLVQEVASAMCAIPFGETRTYGQIAKDLGVSAQAVGQACGANPIPIIVPCHRVMGANGKLTGYSGAGGVETKIALLRHEGAGGFLL